MFTGLVETTGTTVALERRGEQARLTLEVPFAGELAVGDSLAVNGCCLTVAALDGRAAVFDLLARTLEVTSLEVLAPGDPVNLERALKVGDRLGGHFVQGHVDATGEIVRFEPRGQDHHLVVALPARLRRYCIPMGSLAVDGISLTIAELDDVAAGFWITPHTRAVTNLRCARPGRPVNLEADLLAKHLEQLLARPAFGNAEIGLSAAGGSG
jgi:riboflavin synthase